MKTYQDLKQWVLDNKGEEVAEILEMEFNPCLKDKGRMTLSEVLSRGFNFGETVEGIYGLARWDEILDELEEIEEVERGQTQQNTDVFSLIKEAIDEGVDEIYKDLGKFFTHKDRFWDEELEELARVERTWLDMERDIDIYLDQVGES